MGSLMYLSSVRAKAEHFYISPEIQLVMNSAWNTDSLEISGILTKLGYKNKRMQEAIDLVISKQG